MAKVCIKGLLSRQAAEALVRVMKGEWGVNSLTF